MTLRLWAKLYKCSILLQKQPPFQVDSIWLYMKAIIVKVKYFNFSIKRVNLNQHEIGRSAISCCPSGSIYSKAIPSSIS